MNRLLQKRWFTLLLSLVTSMLLVTYVYSKNATLSTNTDSSMSVTTSKVITEVPINIIDTSNSKYLSGLPETVTVTLEGPRNILNQLTNQNVTVETDDLANLENGTRTITLKLVGLPSSVSGVIANSTQEVTIKDLVTRSVAVTPVVGAGVVADGYTLGNVTTDPATVTLTGSAEEIDKVASVTATIPATVTNRTETFTQNNVTVVVRDDQGNILDVRVNKQVSITVPIQQTVVTVPLNIVLTNENSNYTYTISSQSATTAEVAPLGKTVTSVSAIVDVNQATANMTVEANILVPDGVTLTKTATVTVTITVTAKSS